MKVTVNWEQRMTFEADTESGHKVKMDAGKPAGDFMDSCRAALKRAGSISPLAI